jgi:hypothetical protein
MPLRDRVPLFLPVLLLVLGWSLPSLPAREAEEDLAQHRHKLGVVRWHAAGYRGNGVKICVLDSDFAGYRAELGQTLPGRVTWRSFRRDGSLETPRSGHGLRAAQVIHSLAPGAELFFANWDPDSPQQFLDAVRWAKTQGVRIINCSITSAAWGDGQGGGPLHARLERLLGNGNAVNDPLFFCSAGNMALGHWVGLCAPGHSGLHEWKPGVIDNQLIPYGQMPIKIAILHKPGNVYEILVTEGGDREVIARRVSESGNLASAGLSFTPRRNARYWLRVRLVRGKASRFHCVVRYADLAITTDGDSVCCFPADNAAVVTVGASNWAGKRDATSAWGRSKPELIAPVPIPGAGTAPSFGGTSAAAPQAAALAALLAESQPRWTAAQLRQALLRACRPCGNRGARLLGLPTP